MVAIAGTGNETCDRLMNIDFNGNVIHALWFKTIVKENGKADLVAINILADIVYWYRPTPVRDEESGKVIGYRKKFKADLLQRNYDSYADQFGLSKRQVTDAFARLEKIGIIQRVFRTLNVNGMLINNVLHIDLNYDGLIKYSTEEVAVAAVVTPVPKKSDPYHEKKGEGSRKKGIGIPKKSDSCPEKKGDLPRKKVTPITSNEETNTKTTTEITTKTTTKINNNNMGATDMSVGVNGVPHDLHLQEYLVVVELLKKIGATENKAVELLSAYGVETIRQKLYILAQQKDITNPVGFIVKALRDNYTDARVLAAEQKQEERQKAVDKNKRLGEQSLLVQDDEFTEDALEEVANRKALMFQGTFGFKYKLRFSKEPSAPTEDIRAKLFRLFSTEEYESTCLHKKLLIPSGCMRKMMDEYFSTAYPDNQHDIEHFLSDQVFSSLALKYCE